jgi:hypothetical protein
MTAATMMIRSRGRALFLKSGFEEDWDAVLIYFTLTAPRENGMGRVGAGKREGYSTWTLMRSMSPGK